MKRKHRRSILPPASARRPDAPATATEREIKLDAPESAWSGLVAAFEALGCRTIPLQAVYYDTTDGALAAARIGLRVRREGDRWVQTLKAPGAHAIARLEDNIPLGPAGTNAEAPLPDLSRHVAAAGDALRDALDLQRGEALPGLVPVFEVRIRRRVSLVTEGSTTVELALDEGELLANGRRRPVRELELELVEGDMRDLLAVATAWRRRWGLWISTATKARRGNLLAVGEHHGQPVGSKVPRPARGDVNGFAASVLDVCLEQVMGNAGPVAEDGAADEHVHQLRVGLRRLRTALRTFPGLSRDRAALDPALAAVFRGLGQQRDARHVMHRLERLMVADGLAPPQLEEADVAADAAALVRGDAFQDAILRLLARAEALRRGGGGPVLSLLRDRIGTLHRQVARDGRRFTSLSPKRQHRVRKRLKRLRFLSEFATSLFAAGAVDRYVAVLQPAQDLLGDCQDVLVALDRYGERDDARARAAPVVEWLSARAAHDRRKARNRLRKLDRAKRFWKRG